jgi:hypothetical protein
MHSRNVQWSIIQLYPAWRRTEDPTEHRYRTSHSDAIRQFENALQASDLSDDAESMEYWISKKWLKGAALSAYRELWLTYPVFLQIGDYKSLRCILLEGMILDLTRESSVQTSTVNTMASL